MTEKPNYITLKSQVSPSLPLSRNGVREVIMASKGATILVLPGKWVILQNMPFHQLASLINSLNATHITHWTWNFEETKHNAERKYSLAKLKSLIITASFRRLARTIHPKDETSTLHMEGVTFKTATATAKHFVVSGTINATIKPGAPPEIDEKTETCEQTYEKPIIHTTYHISDEQSELARLIRSVENEKIHRFHYMNGGTIIDVEKMPSGVETRIARLPFPSPEDLAKCSRFYTIAIPELEIRDKNLKPLYRYTVYINGRRHAILTTRPLKSLFLRITRRKDPRLKKRLPHGASANQPAPLFLTVTDTLKEAFTKFTETIRTISQAIDRLPPHLANPPHPPTAPDNPDDPTTLLRELYIKTPKRKIHLIHEWINLFNMVKDLAPASTLYVVFYGRGWRTPNFPAFAFSKDGKITVLPFRTIPSSGITFKGGEFEQEYRRMHGIDRLLRFQMAPRRRKAELLLEDALALRDHVKPETPLNDAIGTLHARARENPYTTNIIEAFYAFTLTTTPPNEKLSLAIRKTTNILAGIVKTGRLIDILNQEEDFWTALRTAIKYTIKKRGYSPRKGVIITGNPEEVKRKTYEVINHIHGRLLALLTTPTKTPTETPTETPTTMTLNRITALLHALSPTNPATPSHITP